MQPSITLRTAAQLTAGAGAGLVVGSALRNAAGPSNPLASSLMWVGSIAIGSIAGNAASIWAGQQLDYWTERYNAN